MCIIIAKEKNGRLPKEEELKNSFEYNNDGAGFMYVDNGKVVIDKGYMDYKSFIKHYEKLLKKYNNFNNKSLVIHCRIGTSGKNNKGNTHPYPITKNEKLLHKSKIYQDIGIAHNGIIHNFGTPKGLNDTQEFIIKFLYPIYSNYREFYKNKELLDSIETLTNSKFTILDNKDNLYFIGDFIEDNGLYFSNDSYKSYYYSKYYYDYPLWYEKAKEKQESYNNYNEDYYGYEETDNDYIIPLESNWYIDLYGNGNLTIVGDKDYWYNYDTLDLYENVEGDFLLIAKHPYIYDENWEEVY